MPNILTTRYAVEPHSHFRHRVNELAHSIEPEMGKESLLEARALRVDHEVDNHVSFGCHLILTHLLLRDQPRGTGVSLVMESRSKHFLSSRECDDGALATLIVTDAPVRISEDAVRWEELGYVVDIDGFQIVLKPMSLDNK